MWHPADSTDEEKIGLHGRKLGKPFETLAESEELKWLFNKYPRLPGLLNEIWFATQEPPTQKSRIPESLMKGAPPPMGTSKWNKDRGIHDGLEKLKKTRKQEDEDGEAIREYGLLVTALQNEAYDR